MQRRRGGSISIDSKSQKFKRWIQLHINDLVALRERLLQMDGKDHYIQEIDELLSSKKYI